MLEVIINHYQVKVKQLSVKTEFCSKVAKFVIAT